AFILAGVIFALRKPELKTKFIMFFAGTLVLLVANVFRIYFVLLAGKEFGVPIAELFHTISWLAMSGIILFFWYYATIRLTGIKNFEGFL
ncbi:MAG: exosortase/archaeosortase family protein, partial [Candidatus Woesearchaeota archaeon]|nr:exosortase/archaeosortase family protein [Candidatus Woesearchaeota archaeon]